MARRHLRVQVRKYERASTRYMRVQVRTCTHMRVRVRDISVRVLRVWVRAGDGCVRVRGLAPT